MNDAVLLVFSFTMAMAVAALVSLGVTGLVVKYGKKLKIMDDPKTHKHVKVVHSVAVPRGGGIPIFVALVVGTAIFLPWDMKLLAIILAAGLITLTGFLDDRFEERVSPYLRLMVNGLAALLVIGVGVGIPYVSNPFGGVIRLDQPQICFWALGGTHCVWVLSNLFTLAWLVGLQNIVGWSSGVDGQLPGFVIIAAATLGILAMRFGGDPSQLPVIILAAVTAGAYLGFLGWNWWPQKIIPGYGGKSLAGFLLGVLAILSGAKVGALILILGIPLVDAGSVIVKRLKEGRSPVWGGREHLHHYLLEAGWSKQRIALLYTGASALFAILALSLKAGTKSFTMASIVLLIAGLILWLHYFSAYLKQPDRDSG